VKYLSLVLVMLSLGCAFDPICEPNDEPCEFAEEIDEMSTGPDAGVAIDDVTVEEDMAEGLDMNIEPTDLPPGVCPQVQTCGAEPDHLRKPVVWTEEYGCGANGFQSQTVSIVDGLCDGDTDWHGFRFRPCDTRSFVVEAVIEPAAPACLDRMKINIANGEGFRLCGAEGARCEELPDGTFRAILLVQAIDYGASAETYFFVLDSTSEADAPYTITVRAFQ